MADLEGSSRRPAPGAPDRPATASAGSGSSDMDPRITRALNVQEFIASHPVVESASISSGDDGSLVVKARLTTTSYKTRSKTQYVQNYFVSEQNGITKTIETSMESVSEQVKMTAEHPAGDCIVSFKVTSIKEKKKRIIQIRDTERDVYDEIDVTDTHADFLCGEHWGNPTWSENERLLVYVAEQHAANWKDEDEPYTAYTYAPNFGEQLSAQTRPGLFILDFSDPEDIYVKQVQADVEGEDSGTTVFRQPALAPRETKDSDIVIYATGSSLLPDGRRLGSIYCCNRPDAIYHISVPASVEIAKATARRISNVKRSARYARVLHLKDGHILVYVSNRRGYEHNSCATLHKRKMPIDPTSAEVDDILVKTVSAPSYSGGFPGLFPDNPPSQCLLTSSGSNARVGKSYIVLGTAWGSRTTIILVDLEDGSVQDAGSNEITSYRLLSTDNSSQVIAIRSSTISPPEIVLGTFASSRGSKVVWSSIKSWQYRFQESKHFSGINALYSTIVPLPDRKAAEAIVISGFPLDKIDKLPGQPRKERIPGLKPSGKCESSNRPPLIICPHGGPNSQYSAAWNIGASLAWIAAGYTVAMINYPGSTGFGQDTIEDLSKDCGNLEVQACLDIKNYLIKLGIASDDKGKRLYLGGSHSGFIGAHLSVRWPNAFDAIDLRNPVIDLPSMFATSDIPDWTLSQLNFKYDYDNPPSFVPQELHMELRKRSPSYYAEKLFSENGQVCATPTQVQLGASDLRVPSNQGKAWFHCLKGHKEDVKMLFFPDNGHPLEQIWTQRKSLTAQLEFLVKHSKFD